MKTALTEYVRLEAPALWRAAPDAQRREVVVSFGNATLIIMDKNEVALAHWSLAAVERINPRQFPALYSPGADAPERLEVADTDMIEAIGRVKKAISGGGRHPGRLRRFGVLATVTLLVLGLSFWLPSALASYAARLLPEPTRTEIGRDLASEMSRLAGTPCQSQAGTRALRLMAARLFPGEPVSLSVYPAGIATVLYLPGDIGLMGRTLVEDHQTPQVAAAHIVAARLDAQAGDPIFALLDFVGPVASIRLITTGRLPESAVDRYAEHLLKTQVAPKPEPSALLDAMERAEVSVLPYANAADTSEIATTQLIAGNRVTPDTEKPILSDSNWVALAQICRN